MTVRAREILREFNFEDRLRLVTNDDEIGVFALEPFVYWELAEAYIDIARKHLLIGYDSGAVDGAVAFILLKLRGELDDDATEGGG